MPERRRNRSGHAARAAAMALAAALLMSGCSSPLAASEAVATFDEVAEDVLAATQDVRPMSW